MDAGGAGRIILGLEIIPLLFYVGAAARCVVSVSQPAVLEADFAEGAVTVPCSFSTAGCRPEPPTKLWFRLGAQKPETLCVNGQCSSKADKFTVTEDLARNQTSLTVSRLTANDSAIYICGIALPSSGDPRAKQTGAGTVLVVRESKGLSTKLQRLLVAVLSLLSIYFTGVLVVFVVLSKSKSKTPRRKERDDSQKKKSARRLFQEIAQELYSKRHVGTSQLSEKDNTYENRRACYNCETP